MSVSNPTKRPSRSRSSFTARSSRTSTCSTPTRRCRAVKELDTPAACIVKHATPCGFATGDRSADGVPQRLRRRSAGGVRRDRGAEQAGRSARRREAITSIDKLLEVIVAPAYDADALRTAQDRDGKTCDCSKSARLGRTLDRPIRNELHMHKIVGGYLVQERDLTGLERGEWKVVSKRQPTEQEMADLQVAWLACKHVKSNAIVIAKDGMMLGSGAGQQDRVNACRHRDRQGRRAREGRRRRERCVLPLPRRPAAAAGRRRHRDHPSRRIGEGPGDDRSGQPLRRGDGADGTAAFQALTVRSVKPEARC